MNNRAILFVFAIQPADAPLKRIINFTIATSLIQTEGHATFDYAHSFQSNLTALKAAAIAAIVAAGGPTLQSTDIEAVNWKS